MEMKITEEKENPFLERKELTIELEHSGESTPQRKELVKNLASKYKVDENCINVDHIFTKKGIGRSLAKVKIYKKPIVKKKEKPKPEVKEKPKEAPEIKEKKEKEPTEVKPEEKKEEVKQKVKKEKEIKEKPEEKKTKEGERVETQTGKTQ